MSQANTEVVNWREHKKKLKEWKKQKEDKRKNRKNDASGDAVENVANTEESKNVVESQDDKGRKWTLSIALPASILLNSQSPELKTYLAGQVARAATVFNIDEIVIFDEFASAVGDDVDPDLDDKKRCLYQFAKILEYLECPQYLRKYLFPMQTDLQFAGLLNPLDSIHHLKTHDLAIPYREGVVSQKPTKETSENSGSYIYVGLENDVQIDRVLKPGVRVTVHFDPNELQPEEQKLVSPEKKRRKNKKIKGKAVAPSSPRTVLGLYWGYTVRIAGSLSAVYSESPFKGYDLVIGTSERGDVVDDVLETLPNDYKHCIIVFGGLKGIESALDSDEKLAQIDDPRDMFNYFLNTCPNQGSNTIRTEEAILITLAALRPRLVASRS
ncbi:putative methyltransferase C9orf114 [Halotydeus destructor]|nr:putative methyltransferase C9orf114 [Halotydeus destructor]